MSSDWCLLILILTLSGVYSVQCQLSGLEQLNSDEEEPKEGFTATIKSLREELKSFLSVKSVNFVMDRRRDLWDIYKAFSTEFREEFTFSVLTEEFFLSNSTFLEKFARRNSEMEREGFVIHLGLHDRVPDQFQSMVLRDNGFYLVIAAEDESTAEEQLLENFYSAFHKIRSITMSVIYKRQLWTFNPFARSGNGSFGALELYRRGMSGDSLKYELLRNLHGYPLIVEFFESGYNIAFYRDRNVTLLQQYLGPDSVSVEVLRDKMNFTAIFQPPDKGDAFGVKLDNGTFTGCLGRMINRKSDLAITGFFIKDYLSPDVEFTSGIYQDELCLISRKASRIPQSLLPLVCFEVDLWVCLFLTMGFAGLFWSLVRQLNRRIVNQRSVGWLEFLQIIVDTAMLTISAPLRKFPRINSERAFIASICLISLVFVSIFQSSLSTVFIKPIFYKDIMSLKDLAETKLLIYVKYAAMMQDMFPQGSTGVIGELHDQMRQVSTTSSIMAQLSVAGDFVTVTRRCTTHQDNAYYFSARKLHMIPECPRIYNLAYMVRTNSVYLDRVNEILLLLNNGGFHEKWIRDLNYMYAWLIRLKYGSFHEDPFKVLTMGDLQLPFYILGIGFSISAVFFVCEWVKELANRCRGRK